MSYANTHREDNKLVFDSKFGDTNLMGAQHKGLAEIDGQIQFVKLDELNPTINGSWENKYDYLYSSVSEAIVSCLVNNMESSMDSLSYSFDRFQNGSKSVTGTYSLNYLRDNEAEVIMSDGSKSNLPTATNLDTYVEKVIDVKFDKRFTELTKLFVENGVNQKDAEEFLLQQAAFDLLTGNMDRLNNPSNFVFAYNPSTQTARPINMDYGRCLKLYIWAETAETNYNLKSEYHNETIQEFAENMAKRNDSILNPLKQEEIETVLKEKGFKPFVIDIAKIHEDLDQLLTKIKNVAPEITKFATVKIQCFKNLLMNDNMQKLYVDRFEAGLVSETALQL